MKTVHTHRVQSENFPLAIYFSELCSVDCTVGGIIQFSKSRSRILLTQKVWSKGRIHRLQPSQTLQGRDRLRYGPSYEYSNRVKGTFRRCWNVWVDEARSTIYFQGPWVRYIMENGFASTYPSMTREENVQHGDDREMTRFLLQWRHSTEYRE